MLALAGHMEEHSRFLDGRFGGGRRWGGMVNGALQGAQKADKAGQASIVGDLDEVSQQQLDAHTVN